MNDAVYILRYDDDLIKRVYKYEREEVRRNAMLVNSGSTSTSDTSKADASTGATANPFVLDDETVKTLDASSAGGEGSIEDHLEDSISEAELNNAENPSISEVVTSFLQLGRMNAEAKMSPITAISSITDAVNNELRSLVSTPAALSASFIDTTDSRKMSKFRREILDLLQFQDKMSTSGNAKQQQLGKSKLAAYMRSKGFDARMLIMMCDNLVHVSHMEQK